MGKIFYKKYKYKCPSLLFKKLLSIQKEEKCVENAAENHEVENNVTEEILEERQSEEPKKTK